MRLHEQLATYLSAIEQAVEVLPVYVERYSEEILTPERANLRIRLRFANGHLLEINEAIVIEQQLVCLGYRYHFQAKASQLVFRYDDTPHFPDLPSFPHHKHWQNTVLASTKPDVLDVLTEALKLSGNDA